MFVAAWHPAGAAAARRALGAATEGRTGTWLETSSCALFVSGDSVLDRRREVASLGSVAWDRSRVDEARPSLSLLRGAYALARAGGDGLELARGVSGGRSLYYARCAGGGYLASTELRPLLRAVGVPALDRERLAAACANAAPPDVRSTVFRGVRRLAACESLRLDRGGEHFRPRDVPPLTTIEAPVPELARELWRRLEDAVARGMEGRSHVAVATGGGLDSGGLLAAAVARGAQTGAVVTPVSLSFGGEGDDRPHLDALSAMLGVTPARVTPSDAGRFLNGSFVADAQPYSLGVAAIDRALFDRAKRVGADVMLSGYAADEILAGDLRALAATFLGRDALAVAKTALGLALPWETKPLWRLRAYLIAPLLKPWIPPAVLRRRDVAAQRREYAWAGPELVRVFESSAERNARERAPRDATERYLRFAASKRLVDYADMRTQIEALGGLRRVDPYQDDELIAFLAQVKPINLLHRGEYRGLFREALRGHTPESHRLRPDKAYFENAFATMLETAGGFAAFRDLARARRLVDLGIVDPDAYARRVVELEASVKAGKDTSMMWPDFLPVIAAELFLHAYDEGALL